MKSERKSGTDHLGPHGSLERTLDFIPIGLGRPWKVLSKK